MNKKSPEQLAQMVREVIEAGKATNLICESHLNTLEHIVVQVHKRYAREQVRVALTARKEAALVKVRHRKVKFAE